jgi:hypothetical protein
MIPTISPTLGQVAASLCEASLSLLVAHPYSIFGLGLVLLPWLALWVLNGRLQPGALPHQVGLNMQSALPVASEGPNLAPLKAKVVDKLESDASRALRRVSRERGSATAREEARRKLLQLQSRVRFGETVGRRSHEHELTKLLVEAARYGITVTPEETFASAV